MTGLLNNNFIVGMLLARDLPQQDQFLTGLAAGQMPADSAIGPLLLKPIVDQLVSAENDLKSAALEATGLRSSLRIELPAETASVTLKVPGATRATFARVASDSTDGTAVDAASGVVTLPAYDTHETIAVTVDGVVRQVVVVRAAAAQTTVGAPPSSLHPATPAPAQPPSSASPTTATPTTATPTSAQQDAGGAVAVPPSGEGYSAPSRVAAKSSRA